MALIKFQPQRKKTTDDFYVKTYFKAKPQGIPQIFFKVSNRVIEKINSHLPDKIQVDIYLDTDLKNLIAVKPDSRGAYTLTRKEKTDFYQFSVMWPHYCPANAENLKTVTLTSLDFGEGKKFYFQEENILTIILPE